MTKTFQQIRYNTKTSIYCSKIFNSISILLFSLLLATNVFGQSFEGLQKLDSFNTQTYYSKGYEVKAVRMAKQLDRVMQFYQKELQFTPTVSLLILSPEDWSKHTKFPFYGMPHYTNQKTLIVASEDNPFWKNSIPNISKLSKKEADLFTQTYTNQHDSISLESFFDLLAIHEIGHAYQSQGQLSFQRKWMGELFANMLLHTYIAEIEPDLLPALTLFPKTFIASTNKASLTYTSLNDLETYYNELGKLYPQNYAWYQSKWHVAAGEIYDSSKMIAIKNWFTEMKSLKEVLDDTTLANFLNNKIHQSVGNVMLHWNE